MGSLMSEAEKYIIPFKLDWLLQRGQLEQQTYGESFTGGSKGIYFTVPSGEVWLLLEAGLIGRAAATYTCTALSIYVTKTIAGVTHYHRIAYATGLSANTENICFPSNIADRNNSSATFKWLFPNDTLNFVATFSGSATHTITVNFVLLKFDVRGIIT